MLLSKALVKFPRCIVRVAHIEEFQAEQVQGMNGEPGLEKTFRVWLIYCTRRPRVTVIDVLECNRSK